MVSKAWIKGEGCGESVRDFTLVPASDMTDDERIAADILEEAMERLCADPTANLSDLRARVPDSERVGWQLALEGFAMAEYAHAKGWL